MIDRRATTGLDPAKDSALLLQRMGFFTLGIALPVSAMVSRRAAVVLAPIGVALLVIAAFLSEPERFIRSLKRRSIKATALVLALLVGWSLLSTTWAPAGARGIDRIVNMLFALVIGIMGVAALPERVRAANLNALAVGAGLATVIAAITQATGYGLGDTEDDATILARGMALIVILTGPLVAWLLSRGRTKGAVALFATVAATSALVRDPVLVAALAAGTAAFALVAGFAARTVSLVATGCVLVVVLAPVIPWVIKFNLGSALGLEQALIGRFANWASTIAAAPVKLITGHGFGAVLAPLSSTAPSGPLPTSILVDIWHELGLVGAAAFATAIWFAMRAVRVLSPVIQAGAIAAYIAALSLGILGFAAFRAWWLMTLVALVIITTAVARGQARTDRPLVRFARAETAAAELSRPTMATRSNTGNS
jgi:hypothetical protein